MNKKVRIISQEEARRPEHFQRELQRVRKEMKGKGIEKLYDEYFRTRKV